MAGLTIEDGVSEKEAEDDAVSVGDPETQLKQNSGIKDNGPENLKSAGLNIVDDVS